MSKAIEKLDRLISELEADLGVSAASSAAPKQAQQNGRPVQASASVAVAKPLPAAAAPISADTQPVPKAAPAKKEAKPAAPAAAADPFAEFNQAIIQVSKVTDIKRHPEAEKLFVATIDIGGGASRQLCAGLVGFYTAEELLGKHVVTILNLKPRKLKGVESQAMILAGDDAASNLVRILTPPEGSDVGDRVFLQGQSAAVGKKEMGSTAWTNVVAALKVKSGVAAFNDINLVTSKGNVSVADLPEGSGIH
eukprot:TRINITY_DN1289_c0_g1_i1.p2 TRINITY_DN1289_c0_g1~~TRINITY_DN1289_c0_g1_i1.p2  ORF type:complete len:251 (-),score=104.89 TRINITY_DN1289_c0_g1_i1:41-793(-)